jgi:TolA-binding protein
MNLKQKAALGLLFGGISFQITAQNTLTFTSNDSHYRNGLEYFERSNYMAAKNEFNKFLENMPDAEKYNNHDQIEAAYFSTICSLFLRSPEADMQANRFVANYPNHPRATKIYSELGNFNFANEDFERAIYYYQKIDVNQQNLNDKAETSFKLGISYQKTNQLPKALAAFSEAKNAGNDIYSPMAAYYSGVINFKQEQYDRAITDFRTIEKHPTYQAEAPIWIANSYYKLGRMEELVRYAQPLLQTTNTNKYNGELALLLGNIHFQNKEYDQAIVNYEIYKKSVKNALTPDIQYHLGYAYFKLKKYNEASEYFKNLAVRNDEIGQNASYYLGVANLNTQNLTGALTGFDAAKRLNFNKEIKEDASFNLAKLYYAQGNNSMAIKYFLDFKKEFPSSQYTDETNELISEAYLSSNNYLAAINHIENLPSKTKKINAVYQQMTYNQAVTEFANNNYDKTLYNLIKSTQYPENQTIKDAANYLKGEVFFQQGKYTEAIGTFENLQTEAYIQKANYTTGYIFFNQKQYPKATGYFKDYTSYTKNKQEANYSDALSRLADCYLVQKQYAAAQQTYDIISLSTDADKDYALYQKAQSLLYQDKLDQSKEALTKIILEYPNSVYADDALYKLGEIELSQENSNKAAASFGKLINTKTTSPLLPDALAKRAIAYTNLENYEAAIKDYRTIINKHLTPENAQGTIEGLQDVLARAGRSDELQADLEVYRKKNPDAGSTETLEFESIRQLYYNNNYNKAIAGFTNFIKSYPVSSFNTEAKFLLAESYHKSGQKADALKKYYEVIATTNAKYYQKSVEKALQIELANKNYINAITNYKYLANTAATPQEKNTAYLGIMDAYFTLKNTDSTLAVAKSIVGNANGVEGAANKAQLTIAKVYLEKNEKNRANLELEAVQKLAKDVYGAEAKYLQCKILFDNKEYDKCMDMVDTFPKDYPKQFYWQGMAYLLSADSALILKQTAYAKQVLNALIETSDDPEIVEKAKSKLSSIK